jgi:hypothetical protein
MLGSAFISRVSSGKAKKLRPEEIRDEVFRKSSYFVFFAYRFWKRSTRPAVSTNFCVPVKKGWHLEQMPIRMSFRVERVLRMFPHAQWITASTYSGCILAFMVRAAKPTRATAALQVESETTAFWLSQPHNPSLRARRPIAIPARVCYVAVP